ncbi:MAG: transporter [Planctomycetes bacterium]|nr:transporter [Planctomycetota bacterium]
MFGDTNGGWLRSDHMFDGFISPVTNPFLFEDPRSLTEVRPVFIYQRVPGEQRDFRGGNISFFGAQARVALSDRWSVVMNKFGGVSVNTNPGSAFRDETGFAELWLGPKYTFWRGEDTGSLAAAGLQFQLPVGSRAAFQDTGTLSLVPYVSYGQNFLRDFRLGSFNFLASTGYSFSTNNRRSDYYWLSAHLDFDAGNFHRFYPLVELNWLINTTNGRERPMGAEGRDLINFGAAARGAGLLTGAFGARVKLTEHAQFGAAFEFPFAGRKDFFRHRFTVDFILRY